MQDAFLWPQMYNFPPFFTKQPNRDTEAKRVQIWRDLILSYCRHHTIYVLELSDSTISSTLFCNSTISRCLSKAEVSEILQMMCSAGLAEWISGEKSKCMIFWRSPSEWADIVYAWVTSQLVGFAQRYCHSRLVSSLEGGYDVEALARSVAVHVAALMAG